MYVFPMCISSYSLDNKGKKASHKKVVLQNSNYIPRLTSSYAAPFPVTSRKQTHNYCLCDNSKERLC